MADNSGAVLQSGAQGAGMGSVAGPYGTAIGSALGVIGGLMNNSADKPTPDLTALFNTISQSGTYEQSLINQLPANLQPLYAQYKASLGTAGTTLQSATDQTGQQLMTQTQNNYGANAPAVQQTLAALKQQDYSTLPGNVQSLKANLAATGGLENGGAAKALTQATMAPAAQYSQQAANVQGQQLNAQQTAVQSAINKVAAMDDATANALFGMSTAQATTILNSGRQDLQQQLAQLINQSNIETNQNLAVEGIQSNSGYQNAVAQNTGQAAIVNGLANTGGQLASAIASTPSATPDNAGGYNGYGGSVTDPGYQVNNNPTAYGLSN